MVERKGFELARGVEEWNALMTDEGFENCLKTCCVTANGRRVRNDIVYDRNSGELMDEKERK